MTELSGRVAEFDEAVGLGTVTSGSSQYRFHCTQIAGGSRTIAVGTEVSFTVAPGHLGAWEAAELRPYPSPGEPEGRS